MNPVSDLWYFAYGSNMQAATFRGRRGITWTRAQAGRAPGWRLVLDKPPLVPGHESFATMIPAADAETFGVLYAITADDMAHIDLTEGVLIGNYRRIEIAVEPLQSADKPVRAFTLVSDEHAPELRPSARYMALLVEGAEEHSLPAAWIAYLRTVPTAVETAETAHLRAIVDASLSVLRRP